MAVDIAALDHVQLAMPAGQEHKARAFYEDVLGLSEIDKPPRLAARGGCWFERNGVIVHMGVEEPFAPARKAHPAFTVSDLEAAKRAVQAAGFRMTPDDSVPHVRRFFTDDPFGNRIELIQQGDAF